MVTFEIHQESELNNIVEHIASILAAPQIITLSGPLGAGKTTLVKHLTKYLGSGESVTSPTFSRVHEYKAKHYNLYHLDCYRQAPTLEQLDELYSDQKALILIEWPEKLEFSLQGVKILQVKIKIMEGSKRVLTIQ